MRNRNLSNREMRVRQRVQTPQRDASDRNETAAIPPRSGGISIAQRVGACCPTRSARMSRDLPRPLPGSTLVAVRFRWRRAKGACHRLISGTPSACSLCGRVVVIPVKPTLGNRPVSAGTSESAISIEAEPRSGDILAHALGTRCRRSAAWTLLRAGFFPSADALGYVDVAAPRLLICHQDDTRRSESVSPQ
jgi:hypothetical protein